MNLLLRRVDEVSTLAPINLYTDPAFLDVVANVYHAGKRCRVRDYAVDGEIFRLLDVEGSGALTSQTFLDMHEPLGRVHADVLRLRALPRLDGVARPLVPLNEFRRLPGWERMSGAPTVLWAGFPTWGDYLDHLKLRHAVNDDLRRGRRLRESIGELEFRADDDAGDVLPTCFAWKSQRDLSLGRADLFANPKHRRFFHELCERNMLRASTLRGGGQLLSIWLGVVHNARWTGWIFVFNPDPALSRFSPGQQLLYPMLELSCRQKHCEFDFSLGLEPYKLKFATHVRPIVMVGTPALAQRSAAVARWLLMRHPWLHERARSLRRRLSQRATEEPVAALSSGQN